MDHSFHRAPCMQYTPSLASIPSRMPDPEFVQMNGVQIPDSKVEKLSPERSHDLPKMAQFAFDGAGIVTLRSPGPRSTPFYVFKGGKGVFHIFFPLHLTCFSSSQ